MPRTLTEQEYNAIREQVLAKLPPNLSEADYQRSVGPLMEQAIGIAENTSGPLQGSSLERALGGLWKNINPIAIVTGLYGAARHPVDTAVNVFYAQPKEQFSKAANAPTLSEKIGYTASALPVIGPMMAQAGETIASGDIAGGVGQTLGIVAPVAATSIAKARIGQQASRGVPAILEREAAQQVSGRVLAPGNVAFKGRAEAIAPEILRRGLKGSREELAQAADEGMATAGSQIDAAVDAAGGPKSNIDINPIVAQLRRKIDDLSINGQPIVGTEKRVQGLQARIAQLEQTAKQQPAGTVKPPNAPMQLQTFEELKKVRDESYHLADEAKAFRRMGKPKMGAEGFAAAETGSAIRSRFAELAPDLASANADYTFFKTLGDVLDPAQGRPKATAPTQGVTGGAATTGAVVGSMIGPKATFAMSVVRPWIQKMRTEPAWQLADAQSKLRLAAAIRNGNVPLAQRMMLRIEQAGPRSTSPTESQSQTTAPALSRP